MDQNVITTDKESSATALNTVIAKKEGMSIALSDRIASLCIDAVTDGYQDLAVDLAEQLISEYDCWTPSEKSLAYIAAAAYARSLDYSNEMRNCRSMQWLSGQKNGFFSMISKEADRAYKQFLSALMALKQSKTPALKINVTARNAFVAQNQEFNKK